MNGLKAPHLISADRLDGSLIIAFEDGRCGVYSSDLLYATLAQARELHDEDTEVPVGTTLAQHDAANERPAESDSDHWLVG